MRAFDTLFRRAASLCAIGSGLAALMGLTAWLAGRWEAVAFGAGYVPMAPGTAILMLLLSAAAWLRTALCSKPGVRPLAFIFILLVLIASGLFLLQFLLGFDSPLEDWLVRSTESVGDVPVGRMSPLTAVAFVLVSTALLCGQVTSSRWQPLAAAGSRWQPLRWLGGWLALIVLFGSGVIVAGYTVAEPFLYGGSLIPMALLTGVAFLLASSAVLLDDLELWPRKRSRGSLETSTSSVGQIEWGLVVLFLLLAAGIAVGVTRLLEERQRRARQTVRADLEAIANLKVEQIASWRNERLMDGRFFSQAPFVGQDVARLLASPDDAEAKRMVQRWMTLLRGGERYEWVCLFDAQSNRILSVPDASNTVNAAIRSHVAESLQTGKVMLHDLHRDDQEGAVHINLTVPFPIPDASPGDQSPTSRAGFLGVLLVQINPQEFLFPLVHTWPTPSRTAETLLVRQEGDQVLFLNGLRHRPDAPLTLRRPIQDEQLISARALRGETDLQAGLDYRGIPVVAAVRRIPDTPWIMVAKVDEAEVYAPMRRATLTGGAVALLLLLSAALGIAVFWRQRNEHHLGLQLAAEKERRLLSERYETALRESEAHLRTLVNTLPDLVWLKDPQGVYLACNPRFESFAGAAEAEIVGKTDYDFVDRQLADSFKAHDAAAMAAEQPRINEEEVTFACDGHKELLETIKTPMRDANGTVTGVLGIARDITARRRAETALRESEARLRLFIEHAPAALAMFDRGMRYLAVSQRWMDDYHLRNGSILGESHYAVFPEIPERWKDIHQRALGGEIVRAEEDRFDRADGSVQWLRWEVRPWRAADETIGGIVVFSEDITERRNAEVALRESEDRFRRAVTQSPFPILIHAEDGAILQASDSWCEITGYAREELRTIEEWTQLAYGERMEDVREDIDALYALEHRRYEGDYVIRTKAGDSRTWEFSSAPLGRLADGRRLVISMAADVTERRQAEAALAKEAVRLRILMEQSRDGIVILDEQGLACEANKRFAAMLGYSIEEVMGLHVWDWDRQWSREQLLEQIQALGESGEHFETRHRRKDGAAFDVEISTNAAVVDGHKLVFCVCRDISRRKQAEEAIRQKLNLQEQLASIAATVPGAIYSFRLRPDGSMCFPYASPTVEELFGLRPEELQADATPALALIHPDDLEVLHSTIAESARALTPWRLEFRVRAVPGSEIWVEGYSMPRRDQDGSILWHGFLHNITERKRAEEQLHKLSLAVEQSPVSVVITDVTGAIEYINPRFAELTGYTLEEMRGQNPRLLKSGRVPTHVYRDMWETILRGGEWRGEFLNRKKNGELFWESAFISPIVDRGEITHFLGIKEDITERKRLEEERTAIEAQMRQQQKLESIGTLASGVAHEINNPVNGIMNYAQLIQDRLSAEDPLTEFTGEILHETQRVATIVRNLLTFARSGLQHYSPARIEDILEATLSLIRTIIRHDRIILTVDVEPGIPTIECRSQQIQQVLMNLMTNARDALNEKYPDHDPDKIMKIEVRMRGEQDSPTLCVTVEDHGTGITPEVRARIFDPFFTTKGRDKGTGLGLSISHGIVKEHGGRLEVESEPGCWTRIHLELPRQPPGPRAVIDA